MKFINSLKIFGLKCQIYTLKLQKNMLKKQYCKFYNALNSNIEEDNTYYSSDHIYKLSSDINNRKNKIKIKIRKIKSIAKQILLDEGK